LNFFILFICGSRLKERRENKNKNKEIQVEDLSKLI